MMKESLKEFRHLLFFSLPLGGKVAPKGPDEGAGFGHLVGREKVNCPAGAREAGLGHDSSRRFAGFRPAGRGTFPAMGKYPKDRRGTPQGRTLFAMTAYPRSPITGDAYLGICQRFPARKI